MGQDRNSVIRAVPGAPQATLLLLLGSLFAPAAALATDIRCDRTGTFAVPSERLEVRIMDLSTSTDLSPELAADIANRGEFARDFSDFSHASEVNLESEVAIPDLSSRARSLAILKEIFGETVGNDALDSGRLPSNDVPADPGVKGALRGSTAEMTESELPARDVSASETADTNAAEADLPGVPEEESLRYRRQMYRTDI